jgi:hypothetical protein
MRQTFTPKMKKKCLNKNICEVLCMKDFVNNNLGACSSRKAWHDCGQQIEGTIVHVTVKASWEFRLACKMSHISLLVLMRQVFNYK